MPSFLSAGDTTPFPSLNTDIAELLLLKTENKDVSVGAGSSGEVSFKINVPEGYSIASITPKSPTGAYTVCVGEIGNDNFSVIARNFASITTTITISCQILLVKANEL